MTQYSQYTEYFRDIAEKFLGHSEDEKHFFHSGLEEFLNGLQTNVNYPALLLENYDFTYADNGGDNVRKVRTLAFIICDNNKDGEDYERTNQIFNNCELIVDKIYNKLRKDMSPPYNSQEFLKYAHMNNVEVSPVRSHSDQNFGFFVTVVIESYHNTLL